MNRRFFIVSIFVFAALSGKTSCAADPWKGALILPKCATLQLVKSPSDHQFVGKVSQIEWPTTVSKIDGQWVKIRDGGRYSIPPAEGWVRKEDVLNLTNPDPLKTSPSLYYTQQIVTLLNKQAGSNEPCETCRQAATGAGAGKRRGQYGVMFREGCAEKPTKQALASLYWLRGILNEQNKDPATTQIVAADYQTAVCLDCTLADAWLRLGRALATLKYDNNQNVFLPLTVRPPTPTTACPQCCSAFKWSKEIDDCCIIEKCFQHAECLLTKAGACQGSSAGAFPDCSACDRPCPTSGSCSGCSPECEAANLASFSCKATPALYLAWGNALLSKYKKKTADANTTFSQACAKFCLAERCDPTWYKPALSRGKLLTTCATHDYTPSDCPSCTSSGTGTVHRGALEAAIRSFSQAVRLDSNQDEPLRLRADALRVLATAKLCDDMGDCVCLPPVIGCCPSVTMLAKTRAAASPPPQNTDDAEKKSWLYDALASAQAASSLKNNRNPDDLEALARVLGALACNAGTPGTAAAHQAAYNYATIAQTTAQKSASYSAPLASLKRKELADCFGQMADYIDNSPLAVNDFMHELVVPLARSLQRRLPTGVVISDQTSETQPSAGQSATPPLSRQNATQRRIRSLREQYLNTPDLSLSAQ
ncbi:MAG TPA: hypothetical protein VGN12_05470 [Pirellulales bacterium]